jgi:Flp pilus assembly protein protease CpaA
MKMERNFKMMKSDVLILSCLSFGVLCVFMLFLGNVNKSIAIEQIQQKAVAEGAAVWYTCPEGKKGMMWISEVFK